MFSLVSHCVYDFVHPSLLKRISQAGLVFQEILDEVVRELHKVKDEIINGKQCSGFKSHRSIQWCKALVNLYSFPHSGFYNSLTMKQF